MSNLPPLERLKQLFEYQEGSLVRRISVTSNAKKGAIAGCFSKDGYGRVNVDGRQYLIHRIIFMLCHGECPEELDHIDGNRSNNRIENLRAASRGENQYNTSRQKNSTTGYKGVTLHKKSGMFHAKIRASGVHKYIGSYGTAEEAYAAYCAVAKELHGKFFRLEEE